MIYRREDVVCCGVSKAKSSSAQRAKNSPPDCFLNVALRPPPVAEQGSKSARQNKELKECAPSAPHNDYILVRRVSNPYSILYKKNSPVGLFYWLRNRDSNPNKQSQSLSCYRYTIPQYLFCNANNYSLI